MELEKLILGIDIGTSSVKISLLDSHILKSVYSKSIPTKANITSNHQKGDEQDVSKIFKTLQECLKTAGSLMKKVHNTVLITDNSNLTRDNI